MKKIIIALLVIVGAAVSAQAQKFALVDMEYILRNIPAYEMANEELNQLSAKWQKEIEKRQSEASQMYQNYQSEAVYLTADQRREREDKIAAVEKNAAELRYAYFGPEGELYQKRAALVEPIQNEIYEAIKKLADEKGYQAIIDRASATEIIFASPRIDVSNDVLARLGYSK
ncbi:MAG: OmpH family outer membrane protein [Muribaculaceae bacterium]|nr:OmpH family outer membrane protein [Muribaculaceae bacterium]MDE5935405.1 OmpH family outer membrane protein [Muribaculaceae bacterium]MDE6093223.1 OmpH family outer membrane protein [Muribaculaceae bacterium]MDE6343359.1 OmpH family outer membrane protein [Muribaculaceae bacterium]MDE6609573.1 OmpH family outer membrane protein [Muribaculaceae bacterium]